MVSIACDMNESQACALQTLIDRLDFEALSACAHSVQETYDMIMALQCLSIAIKEGAYAPRQC